MHFFTGKTTCVVCGHEASGNDIFYGCPVCKARALASNYTTQYSFNGYTQAEILKAYLTPSGAKGLWAHKAFLPVSADTPTVSISEGNTPLISCKRLGERIGCGQLLIKNESASTTWSYKDRLAAVGVTRALQEKARVVVGSSTGNHGAAIAAYAAKAGLDCVIFTVPQVPKTMKTLMQSFGACVIVLPKFIDRYTLQNLCVTDEGWYPLTGFVTPPIGSNPYGVDGYKTISFEIFDELGDLPDFIAVPSAYSDGLYGTWKGARDLIQTGIAKTHTRMIASEVYGSLEKTLQLGTEDTATVPTNDWTVSFSIGGGKATQQGYAALKESNGLAATSTDPETLEMQKLLASTEGIYAEAASVTSLVAIKKLIAAKKIPSDARVVAVITSSGLKDPDSTASVLPDVLAIEPERAQLKAALKKYYHKDLL